MAAGEYTERHLYRVRLDGVAPPEQVTSAAGMHAGVALANDRSAFVDQYSSADEPVVAALTPLPRAAGVPPAAVEARLHSAREADGRVAQLGPMLTPPRFVSFPSTDGAVTLQAAIYAPDPAIHGPGPYPTVVSCYGGPHVQYVQNSWNLATADLRAQFLRAQVPGADGTRAGAAMRARLASPWPPPTHWPEGSPAFPPPILPHHPAP